MSTAVFAKLKSAAPGQYLGYGMQPIRLCYHLLTATKGSMVSVELYDDVTIHEPDGSLVLEQSKSALKGNPASDRSVELWKTMANWAEQPRSNLGKVRCFRYYVSPLKAGKLVEQMSAAKDPKDIGALLEKFKTPKFQGEVGVGIEPFVTRFLAAGDDICAKIIEFFELVSDADPVDPIRAKFTALIPDETLDQFCAAAIGMAKDDSDKLIRAKQPAIVSASAFRRNWRAFIRKYEFSGLLNPTMDVPQDQQISAVVGTSPTFVRQLSAVKATESIVRTAVSDFLRALSDKVNWADDGEIVESSLEELDVSLLRHHGLTEDEIADVHSHLDPLARGRQLYRRCIELQTPLEGRELPSYFISGEFNWLADECRLGWHPDHKIMFPAAVS
ncbi:hypothetical protein HGP14_30795 [Rhizobium sp. P32RR-XVIII]|uniref:ABC-three component system protein n=1 Tax=Rhizobium sp. P32RR-XVIII TaxID=2726738 RepID=UPI0014576A5D|nr:ABC-three component system protein [Rhizobium sp. P32RR-XVIII]NLS07650.1 hypothetical protein [Rhizobium sp. P32RR-XVIII]